MLKNADKSSYTWDNDFPSVYSQTSVSYLKHRENYICAKNGDISAAVSVVEKCVKWKHIEFIRKRYPDAVLVPVMSRNRLPEAFAMAIGLDTNKTVRKTNKISRTPLSAMERLMYAPVFTGDIARGKRYIVVDDVVTQGGTVSALRKFIVDSGGYVAAAAALASSPDSRVIAPGTPDIIAINEKFDPMLMNSLLRFYRIADDITELTRPQVRYLLRFNDIFNLAIRMSDTLSFYGTSRGAVHSRRQSGVNPRAAYPRQRESAYFPSFL